MGFLSGVSRDFLKEPAIIVMIICMLYVIAVPILSFFMDFWFAFIIISVMLFLGWLAVKTVFNDQGKVSRGRMNNVP